LNNASVSEKVGAENIILPIIKQKIPYVANAELK
jgi:hypothetical protein